jgi:hypothetical protein
MDWNDIERPHRGARGLYETSYLAFFACNPMSTLGRFATVAAGLGEVGCGPNRRLASCGLRRNADPAPHRGQDGPEITRSRPKLHSLRQPDLHSLCLALQTMEFYPQVPPNNPLGAYAILDPQNGANAKIAFRPTGSIATAVRVTIPCVSASGRP